MGVKTTLTAMPPSVASNILSRNELKKLKCKAIRAGVWFKALPRIDRVLVDLTIKVTENIHSAHLAKSIFAVLSKLEGLLVSRFSRSAGNIGRFLAEKISLIGQSWGNFSAKSWSTDASFAFYLEVMHTRR
jgi:hypothetical protein